jgi:hypothetical protein
MSKFFLHVGHEPCCRRFGEGCTSFEPSAVQSIGRHSSKSEGTVRIKLEGTGRIQGIGGSRGIDSRATRDW